MTREQEQALLREYLDTCERLQAGFASIVARAAPMMPMTSERIDALTIGDEDVVLSFLKRFEQFEDALQRTLKLISRAMEHGRIERLTSKDIARRAYALGILDSETIWEGAVRARTALVHQYPLDPVKRCEQLNAAWSQVATLDRTFAAIGRFIETEGLLA